MSKSDENTNELDSYGVWVKNTPGKDQSQLDEQADTLDVPTDDTGLDLPDFDDTDTEFSDMFRDEPQFSVDGQEDDFGNDLDSTLSTDELANITGLGDVAIENVDAAPVVDDFESQEPVFEETSVTEPEVSSSSDTEEQEETDFADIVNDLDTPDFDLPDNIADFDDSSIEDIDKDMEGLNNMETVENSENEAGTETVESTDITENTEQDDVEEEISLDDFMDDGFSDESVAAGNNGYEPGAEKTPAAAGVSGNGSTEEIALDDFLDADSFESITSDPKTEAVVDEAPIDMDITFDDSVDSVETEDNSSLEDGIVYDTEEDMNYESIEDDIVPTEEETPSSDSEEVASSSGDDFNIDTEEVDLSDFGIDSEAEETPIVQDVEDEKNKEKVVDYDLFVEDSSTSSAPVVNEIKDEKVEEIEEIIEEPKNTTTVDNSLLQQIVADLSSLKDEINNIKSNIAEIQSRENPVNTNQEIQNDETVIENQDTDEDIDIKEETVTDEIPIPDVVDESEISDDFDISDETVEDVTVAASQDSETIEDETIVSDDDSTIDDIDVKEESTTDDIPLPDIVEEDELADDISEDETIAEETSEQETDTSSDTTLDDFSQPSMEDFVENEEETETVVAEDDVEEPESSDLNIAAADEDEGGFFSSDDEDETIALSGDELSNIMNNADFGDEIGFEDSVTDSAEEEITPEAETEESEPEIEVNEVESAVDKLDLSDNDSDITLEETDFDEPDPDDISIENTDINNSFYDMPDEIEIPKDDDIFVASTSSDFMDSVKDSTDELEMDAEPLESVSDDNSVSEIEDIGDIETETLDDEIPEEITISEEPVENEDMDEPVTDDSAEDVTLTEENQDIPTVDKVLEEENTDNTEENTESAEESFSDVDFLNNGALEDFDDEPVENTEDSTEDSDEVSFDDVDFLNAGEETEDISEGDTEETEDSEISFDDVDFLNNEDTEIQEDADDTATEEETVSDTIVSDETNDEPEEDTISIDDGAISEEAEPVIEETSVAPAEVNDDFTEVDNLDNNLSTSNIDYLTKEDENISKDDAVNGDLRQEIKSVLLYMDQLLESLPEDKIYEFAKSEEFATYKKLFKDLGLS